jgi:hypothetical protein
MVMALLDRAARWRPDAVVAIVRGGLVPATMAAGTLALPLSFVAHDRATGRVDWIGQPSAGQRVLLVDDCCSRGTTLERARAMLMAEGRECLTLTIVHDPETVQFAPDLSHPMTAFFRLPWERGEATPTGRAARRSGPNLDHAVEAPFHGVCLDAGLLARADLPYFAPDRAVLISALAETGRARLAASLADGPWRDLPIEFRPESVPADGDALAGFKADAATRWGCTHVIESDPAQALLISSLAPHLVVSWWSLEAGRGWTVSAAASA